MNDFLVIGGGIAGAAAGYFLGLRGRVTLLEAERTPGLHSTGRSAALFSEYYGNDCVRSLTRTSRAFYEAPPPGFAAAPLLTPRGV
ncbi:MAG: FAD-binding oxidoreductase, partial [Kitasatospora sp.]|nr:FAD-binding oxidoreductase [Kitasatospora sp.]